MRILIAPDKFKGSMSGHEVAEVIGDCLTGHNLRILPVADGGEGTAKALGDALGGRWVEVEVTGPLAGAVTAGFSLICDESGGGMAVMEMSSASGLDLFPRADADPWKASTYGTGELIIAARDVGVDRIILGIGGSATNDGGAGMARALGVCFLDAEGNEIDEVPERLMEVEQIFPEIRLDLPEITVACDVENPLLGKCGATRAYGKQKGVVEEEMNRQEERLKRFADLVESEMEEDIRNVPGAGAAGGLGFGLMAFCDASLESGFDLVAKLIGLEEAIATSDLIITGEGQIDEQSLMGKAPVGVAKMARSAGKPIVAFCGTAKDMECLQVHFDAVIPLVDGKTSLEESLAEPEAVLKNKVDSCRQMLEQLIL